MIRRLACTKLSDWLWGRLQPARDFSPAASGQPASRRLESRRRLKPAPQASLAVLLILGAIAFGQTSDQIQVRGPAPFPAWNTLKFPALRALQIPKPAEFTLPNGMRLYLLEDHELPTVRGAALIRTGNLFDPPNKIGLAEMTGHVIRSGGSTKMTGDQMDVALEDIAASVDSDIDESDGTVNFSCLKENTDQVLSIFHDVLTSPAFRQD